jgi:hypothetical protein
MWSLNEGFGHADNLELRTTGLLLVVNRSFACKRGPLI